MAEDNTESRLRIRSAAALAPARPAVLALPARLPRVDLAASLRRALAVEFEQRRLFAWLPVCFGAGILLAFQAEGRPGLAAPVVAAAAAAGLAFAARRHFQALAALTALAFLFAGFAAAVHRTSRVEAPVLARTVIASMTGFIEAVEERPQGARLTVQVTALDRVAEPERPKRVRLTVRDARTLAPGQHIAAQVRLLPPPQPAWPGGYDFARDAYYRGIGAVGSVLGQAAPAPAPAAAGPDWRLRLAAAVDSARNGLTQRIAGAVGGQAGAVAAALVTGKRGLIDEPTNDVLRGAGIYHIVSISGLHMVLAAGTFFWLVRALLALSSHAALQWPIKKLAAAAAMAGATAYCVFSGSEVATERSLIMTLVMLGAILVDRAAISVRNLAVAALIVLAREPESLLGPSFQMSFGAVAALAALAPVLEPRIGSEGPAGLADRALRALVRSVIGLFLMTLVASAATAPFSAYHFQTLNPLGLIGNALALPLVSLVVMPAAVLGVLALPFGLDGPIWRLMGGAVEKVLAVAAWVNNLDGATVLVPALGAGALAALSLALILFTLPASRLRWLALLPFGIGIGLAANPVRYDAFVDRDGLGAGIRGRDGRLVLVGKPSAFVVEQWLRADGDRRAAGDAGLRQGARCDRGGCVVVLADGRSAAFVLDAAALEEDCRRAALVITRLSVPAACAAGLVLDRTALSERGAVTVRFDGAATVLRSAGGSRVRTERTERIAPRPVGAAAPEPNPPPPRPGIDLPDADALSSDEPG